MQIKPEQLLPTLNKSLPPLVWIACDDPLLLQEACDQVRASAREQGFSEREVMHAGNDFVWNDLLQSASAMSLFAERKLIDLRLASSKLDSGAKEALQYFAGHPSDDNLLLISSPKVEKAAQSTKWFKTIEGPGVFVAIWPVKTEELPRWISQRLKQKGMTADQDAIRLLAERVEGNLLAAVQEIEKLGIISDSQHLDLNTVMQAVADSARFNIFDLIDAALLGQSVRALKVLQHLQAEGAEPLMVLNLLVRELRSLCQMRREVEQGQNINGVIQSHRVWFNRKAAVGKALQQHSVTSLSAILSDSRIVEQSVKGIKPNNPWDELASLTLRLAGTPTALSA